jgi:hypothetical protein
MKKQTWRLLAAGALAIVGIGGVTAIYAGLQNETFFQAGRSAAVKQDEGIAFIVNGTPISKDKLERSLQTKQLMYEESVRLIQEADFLTEAEKQEQIAGIEPPDRDDAEQHLIREAVLLSIAQERGIVVTDEEVRAQVDGIDATIGGMAASGDQSAQYVRDSLTAYASGLGMTYAEYTEEMIIPATREQLMRTKLREQVIAEAAQNPDEDPWEAFVEEALSNAEIVYPEG